MDFIRAQLTKIPRVIPVDLSRSTVLITGANSGLGLEAAREILISKPERLILAVRDVVKGDEARKLLAGANLSGAKIDVRKLDQSSFKSIQDFVAQLKGERVDIAILNAGVWNTKLATTSDGYESDLQVNYLGPALLSLLLLPNLRIAASKPRLANTPKPHLTIVASGLHEMAQFPQKKLPAGEVLAALNDPKQYAQKDRYPTTKLLNLLWTRSLASKVPSSEIIINASAPGFCKTGLFRDNSGVAGFVLKLAMLLLGRSAEDGARCLVDAAITKTEESHGLYLSEMKAAPESELVRSKEGEELQEKMWNECMEALVRYDGNLKGSFPALKV